MPTVGAVHYQFIHNVFGAFMEDCLDFFGNSWYPRFEHKIVGTYDKAVEYIREVEELEREYDKPNLPSLILNPSGDFTLDDTNSGAKQLWRFPNLMSGFVPQIFDHVYQDRNLRLSIGFTRLKGELELLMLTNSFYEYFDLKLLLTQFFGGQDRRVYPTYFNSFIIIPDNLYNFEYLNTATGKTHSINWDDINVETELIKTTNKSEYILPGIIKPIYTLRGITDASTRHGGIDSLADWRLTATIEYEVEIPSFFVLECNWIAENIHFEISYGHSYSTYENYNIPTVRQIIDTSWESGLKDGENSEFDLPDEASPIERRELVLNTRYFHKLTQENLDSTSNIEIDIPQYVSREDKIIVNSKDGPLIYVDQYQVDIEPSATTIILDPVDLELNVGDIIEVFVYEKPVGSPFMVWIRSSVNLVNSVSSPTLLSTGNPEILSGVIHIESNVESTLVI